MRLTLDDIREQVDPEVATALIESLEQNEQQTYFMDFADGFLLLYRYLGVEDNVQYGNLRYLFLKGETYRFNFEFQAFEKMPGGVLQMISELEDYMTTNEYIIKQFTHEVEKLEDQLFERRLSSVFMDVWFDVKKNLSRFDRFLARHLRALTTFDEWNDKNHAVEELEVEDLIKTTQYNHSNIQGSLSRMDSLHHYYTSIKNDKLNKNIYFLTIVSGIFLPLNLIVGFFGMNTKGLFFEENPMGTMYVVYVLGGVFFLFGAGHTLLRIVDRFVLKFLLGRTAIYKNISKRIDSLEKRFDVNL